MHRAGRWGAEAGVDLVATQLLAPLFSAPSTLTRSASSHAAPVRGRTGPQA